MIESPVISIYNMSITAFLAQLFLQLMQLVNINWIWIILNIDRCEEELFVPNMVQNMNTTN